MSKHPSKSRMEKSGKTPSVVTLTPVTADIVSGKLTDNDWHALVDRDDSDEFIADIVEEIYQAADEWIYDLYLSKQVIPFTVWQAKDALVQIIEWIYLARDAGPSTDNTHWCEDDEPATSVIDCWAQGSVPRQCVPVVPVVPLGSVVEVEVEPVVLRDVIDDNSSEPCPVVPDDTCNESQQPESDAGVEYIPANIFIPIISEDTAEIDPSISTEVFGQSNFLPTQDPCTSFEQRQSASCSRSSFSDPTEDIESYNFDVQTEFESRIKVDLVDQPAMFSRRTNNDCPIDHQCNPISMKKIPAQKLPTNRIETTFMIVDPQMTDKQYRFSYGRARKCKTGMNTNQSNSMKGQDDFNRTTFVPQSLFETMEVAPGVTVRQMDRVKKGPKVHTTREEAVTKAIEKSLLPIRRQQCNDDINIGKLLDCNVPIIKPLYVPTPVPPISQRSSVS